MRQRGSAANREAFTLIELLVVVAIIALLISMLLPSLDKARGTARMVACQSILKQVGMANHMYSSEYGDWHVPDTVPAPGEPDDNFVWFQNPAFQKLMGFNIDVGTNVSIRRYYPAQRGLICPEARWTLDNPSGYDSERFQMHRAYGHNDRDAGNAQGKELSWAADRATQVRGHRMAFVRQPARKLEYTDAMHTHVSPLKAPFYRSYGETFNADMYHAPAFRHNFTGETGYSNVLYFDSHVDAITDVQLTAEPLTSLWRPYSTK
jgi:prepilin-type N-terminal cleavage/methylation domain-containing protein/prepilin-type processing-associated H-X9-DG protein